ncbi:MAG: hypothetical protein KBC68_03200 [Candidatus Pacebacteria bacterium]|nr:hypothetical protein [Candidatus Paceibacterota bacterium]
MIASMAHHAYFVTGEQEEGIVAALEFLSRERGLEGGGNPNVIVERHGLLKVDDARRINDKASLRSVSGSEKALVIAAGRIFHEAQNALLKTLEEPPEGTTIIVIVPSEGDLLETTRSRLLPLPVRQSAKPKVTEDAEEFWKGSAGARGKVVESILKDAKSDDEEDKLEARARARKLAEGLAVLAHQKWQKADDGKLIPFLQDLNRLIPVLTDRAAPLKPILEHLLITAPKA